MAFSPLVSVGMRPSVVAAAVLLVLRRAKGQVPGWPSALAAMTGYSPLLTPELMACVPHVEALLMS